MLDPDPYQMNTDQKHGHKEHSALQNMQFLMFLKYFCGSFLPFWIRIRIPNPDPLTWLNPDRDPKHYFMVARDARRWGPGYRKWSGSDIIVWRQDEGFPVCLPDFAGETHHARLNVQVGQIYRLWLLAAPAHAPHAILHVVKLKDWLIDLEQIQ